MASCLSGDCGQVDPTATLFVTRLWLRGERRAAIWGIRTASTPEATPAWGGRPEAALPAIEENLVHALFPVTVGHADADREAVGGPVGGLA